MKNDFTQLAPAQLIALARFCQFALMILNARLFTLLTIFVSAWLFGWTMYEPDWIRFAGACAFSMIVGWPAYMAERTRRIAQETQQGE